MFGVTAIQNRATVPIGTLHGFASRAGGGGGGGGGGGAVGVAGAERRPLHFVQDRFSPDALEDYMAPLFSRTFSPVQTVRFSVWVRPSGTYNDDDDDEDQLQRALQNSLNEPMTRSDPASSTFLNFVESNAEILGEKHMTDLCPGEACSVCLCVFGKGDTTSRLRCRHLFHTQCILPWIRLHRTCPNCRTLCEQP